MLEPLPRTFMRSMFNLQYYKRAGGRRKVEGWGNRKGREGRREGGYRSIALHIYIYNLRLILLKSTTPNYLRSNWAMQVMVWKSWITFLPKPVVPSHVSWLCSPAVWGTGEGRFCCPQQSECIESPGTGHLNIPFFFFKASRKIPVFRTRSPQV